MKSSFQAAIGFLKLALSGKEAPSRLLLLTDGPQLWEGYEGFSLDQAQANVVIENFKTYGNDLPIDYDHATLKVPAVKAPAAGWIKGLSYTAGEGLYGDVEWTAAGKADVEAGSYRYHSPVVLTNKNTMKIERLFHVALTNQPKTRHQRELLAASLNTSVEPEDMENQNVEKLKAFLIGAGVKLAENITDEAIVSLSQDLIKKGLVGDGATKNVEVLHLALCTKLGVDKGADQTVILAAIDALLTRPPGDEYKALKDQVNSLVAEKSARAGQELVSLAIEGGKLNPNNEKQMEWARNYAKNDADGFKVWAASAETLFPTGTIIKNSKDLDGSKGGTDRKSIITLSRSEFKGSGLEDMTSEEAFVNDALRTAGMKTLTKDETALLV